MKASPKHWNFFDASIANYASRHGFEDIAARFSRRASGWKNLVNPASGFIQPKRQGAWVEGFDPEEKELNLLRRMVGSTCSLRYTTSTVRFKPSEVMKATWNAWNYLPRSFKPREGLSQTSLD